MSEKVRGLLFSSQQLTYLHKLLGDTMAVGSERAQVQMLNLGSACMALSLHLVKHPSPGRVDHTV